MSEEQKSIFTIIEEAMINYRGLYGKNICKECQGWGVQQYGSTATWRGGVGGQMMTKDVCSKCWGSGNADKPWPSHRNAT